MKIQHFNGAIAVAGFCVGMTLVSVSPALAQKAGQRHPMRDEGSQFKTLDQSVIGYQSGKFFWSVSNFDDSRTGQPRASFFIYDYEANLQFQCSPNLDLFNVLRVSIDPQTSRTTVQASFNPSNPIYGCSSFLGSPLPTSVNVNLQGNPAQQGYRRSIDENRTELTAADTTVKTKSQTQTMELIPNGTVTVWNKSFVPTGPKESFTLPNFAAERKKVIERTITKKK